ncbi:hypothetical protein CYY_004522 [Polysphondylium violaceum]|uniref:Uncharacterized protein n=1 Tax=Polysphondylium violaceum TaxID=133409 RepID=A0A8J4PT85_9MYCE|nr:hypothetical protein CYY_004522 [Polysphondylium violaceum]
MKSLLSFSLILFLISLSNAQNWLYAIKPTPANVLSIYDLNVGDYLHTVTYNQSLANVYTVIWWDKVLDNSIDMVVSFDQSSLSIVAANSDNGGITETANVPLPNGITTNQLSSFSVNIWDQRNIYFLSQVNNQVTLNSLNVNFQKITTMPLFNQATSSFTGVVDVNGNYFVLSVVNNQYLGLLFDTSSQSVTGKVAIDSTYIPPQVFKLVSIGGSSYILELQGAYVLIQNIDVRSTQLTQVGSILVGKGVTNINSVLVQNSLFLVANTIEQTNVYTINTDDFSLTNNTALSYPIAQNSILFGYMY